MQSAICGILVSFLPELRKIRTLPRDFIRVGKSTTLFVLAGLFCAAAYGAAETSELEKAEQSRAETIPLRLKSIPKSRLPIPYRAAQRKSFDDFLRAHPEIEPYSYTELYVQGEQRSAAELMAIAAGTAPDVFGFSGMTFFQLEDVQVFIDQGFLVPLDEYLDPTTEPLNVRVPPLMRAAVERDGHVYANINPAGYGGAALFYRKDLFTEAGIVDEQGQPKPPRTWEELFEIAQKLTFVREDGTQQYGLGLKTGRDGVDFMTALFYQSGCDVVVQDDSGTWRLTINDGAGIRALVFLRKLMKERWQRDGVEREGIARLYNTGANPTAFTEWSQDFTMGLNVQTAMVFDYAVDDRFDSWIENDGLDPYVLGVAPLPAGPAGEATVAFGVPMGVNAAIPEVDTAKRRAAAQFVQFMNGPGHCKNYVDTMVELGKGHLVRPDLLELYGHDEVLADVPREWIEYFEHMFNYIRPLPFCPGYKTICQHTLPKIMDMVLYDERCADPDLLRALVSAEVTDVNNVVFNARPQEVMRRYRFIGWFILAALAFVAAIGAFLALRSARRRSRETFLYERVPPARHIAAWLMIGPAVLATFVWQYVPLARGTVMAFQDYNLIGGGTWIGLDHFIEALLSPLFWKVMMNTLVYVGMSIGIGFIAPIVLALMLTEIRRFTLLFRTIYYLPAVTSPLVLMYLWRMLYHPGPDGFLNSILAQVGLGPYGWLTDPNMAMACIIVAGTWASAGPGSLIYMAALKAVPTELYEAATVDGCGFLRRLVHITFPALKALFVINLLGAFIGAFHAMQNIFVMTGGGPADATRTIGIEIWFNAFMYLRFGYATAMAWILGAMLIGFTLMNLRMLSKVEFRRAEEA